MPVTHIKTAVNLRWASFALFLVFETCQESRCYRRNRFWFGEQNCSSLRCLLYLMGLSWLFSCISVIRCSAWRWNAGSRLISVWNMISYSVEWVFSSLDCFRCLFAEIKWMLKGSCRTSNLDLWETGLKEPSSFAFSSLVLILVSPIKDNWTLSEVEVYVAAAADLQLLVLGKF